MKHYKHEKVKNVIDYGWVYGSMLRIQRDDYNVCGSTKTKTEKITSTYSIWSKSWTKNEKKTCVGHVIVCANHDNFTFILAHPWSVLRMRRYVYMGPPMVCAKDEKITFMWAHPWSVPRMRR
jgi:hypothetical protein